MVAYSILTFSFASTRRKGCLGCPYYMYDGKFGKQNSGSVELGRSGLLAYGRPAERLLAVPGPFTSNIYYFNLVKNQGDTYSLNQ